jgi:hypothetical protein
MRMNVNQTLVKTAVIVLDVMLVEVLIAHAQKDSEGQHVEVNSIFYFIIQAQQIARPERIWQFLKTF